MIIPYYRETLVSLDPSTYDPLKRIVDQNKLDPPFEGYKEVSWNHPIHSIRSISSTLSHVQP